MVNSSKTVQNYQYELDKLDRTREENIYPQVNFTEKQTDSINRTVLQLKIKKKLMIHLY